MTRYRNSGVMEPNEAIEKYKQRKVSDARTSLDNAGGFEDELGIEVSAHGTSAASRLTAALVMEILHTIPPTIEIWACSRIHPNLYTEYRMF